MRAPPPSNAIVRVKQPWEIPVVIVLIGPLITVLVGITFEFTRCGLEELKGKKQAEPETRSEVYNAMDEVKAWINLEEH